MNDPTQDSLQSVDDRRKPRGIYEVEVGVGLQLGGGRLEIFEFEHTVILSNICSIVKHS